MCPGKEDSLIYKTLMELKEGQGLMVGEQRAFRKDLVDWKKGRDDQCDKIEASVANLEKKITFSRGQMSVICAAIFILGEVGLLLLNKFWR